MGPTNAPDCSFLGLVLNESPSESPPPPTKSRVPTQQFFFLTLHGFRFCHSSAHFGKESHDSLFFLGDTEMTVFIFKFFLW